MLHLADLSIVVLNIVWVSIYFDTRATPLLCLRLLFQIRFLKKHYAFRKLLYAIEMSTKDLSYFFLLLFVFIFTLALVGRTLFRGDCCSFLLDDQGNGSFFLLVSLSLS